jgi:signal transduction histidine kinase
MEHRIAQGRTAEAERYLGVTRQALDNASNVTKRMLAFARRQPLQSTAVEPNALISGMVDLIRRSLGAAVHVEVNLRDGQWCALCDANQLENALLNLAINARDAMPNGGTLTITTADRTLGFSDLLGPDEAEPGCYVEIAVTDTGVGMAPDVLPHVFEPFFTTKPAGQGTGLGLSQIYGFVRQSGGFVRLESRVGHGTTVRLFLPRSERTIAGSTSPANEHDAER